MDTQPAPWTTHIQRRQDMTSGPVACPWTMLPVENDIGHSTWRAAARATTFRVPPLSQYAVLRCALVIIFLLRHR